MGSYNISCFVSKITISPDDDVMIFPLIRNNKKSDYDQHLWSVFDLYKPAFFPIPAKYDDYGDFTFPFVDDHIQFIEEQYNCSIDELFSLDNGLYTNNFDGLAVIHKSIYDKIVETSLNDWNGKKYDEQYEKKFKQFLVELNSKVKGLQGDIDFWSQIIKEEGDKDGSATEIIEYAKSQLSGEKSILFSSLAGVTFSFRDLPEIQKLYTMKLNNKALKQPAIDFMKFIRNMYSGGLNFTPSLMGCQHGNVWMNNVIINASKKLVMSKIKKEY